MPQRTKPDVGCYSNMLEVLTCDRSNYTPGVSTSPDVTTANIFSFAGKSSFIYGKSRRNLVGYVCTVMGFVNEMTHTMTSTTIVVQIYYYSECSAKFLKRRKIRFSRTEGNTYTSNIKHGLDNIFVDLCNILLVFAQICLLMK